MVSIQLEIRGLPEMFRKFGRLGHELNDFSPFLKKAGVLLVGSSQENFKQGGRPKWREVSFVTMLLRGKKRSDFRVYKGGKRKGQFTEATEKKYFSGVKALRDTGLLMGSIGNLAKEGVYVIDKGSITIGTKAHYAKYHQEGVKSTGGMIKGKKIPARPFLAVQDEDKVRILAFAVEFVDEKVKEAFA